MSLLKIFYQKKLLSTASLRYQERNSREFALHCSFLTALPRAAKPYRYNKKPSFLSRVKNNKAIQSISAQDLFPIVCPAC